MKVIGRLHVEPQSRRGAEARFQPQRGFGAYAAPPGNNVLYPLRWHAQPKRKDLGEQIPRFNFSLNHPPGVTLLNWKWVGRYCLAPHTGREQGTGVGREK